MSQDSSSASMTGSWRCSWSCACPVVSRCSGVRGILGTEGSRADLEQCRRESSLLLNSSTWRKLSRLRGHFLCKWADVCVRLFFFLLKPQPSGRCFQYKLVHLGCLPWYSGLQAVEEISSLSKTWELSVRVVSKNTSLNLYGNTVGEARWKSGSWT